MVIFLISTLSLSIDALFLFKIFSKLYVDYKR